MKIVIAPGGKDAQGMPMRGLLLSDMHSIEHEVGFFGYGCGGLVFL